MSTFDVTARPAAPATSPGLGDRVESAARLVLRYGLVLVLGWIGGMKFTAYEAEGIRPFAENSPLFAWTYPLLGVQGLSNLLGAVELVVAGLIAVGPWVPKAGAAGGALAAGMFASTLTFLATTPQAWVAESGGFPVISVPGQFVLKDVVLLGAALWVLADGLRGASRR